MTVAPLLADGLTVHYPGSETAAIEDIAVTLQPGRRTAIIGRNGAGKSTFLKALLGLLSLASGKVQMGEGPLQRNKIAYIPQRSEVDWNYPISVFDVVMMGQTGRWAWMPFSRPEAKARAKAAISELGLNGFEHRPIGALSGGQQQRVFLARAFMQEATYYILDEPLAGLDIKTSALMTNLFESLAQAGNLVVAVHHDIGSVADVFDDVVLINRRLIAAGPVGKTLTPDTLASAYAA